MNTTILRAAVAALAGLAATAWADVDVQGAWARATVQGQMASGAFMTLRSTETTRLVSASTPVAGVTEIHEMSMDGGVMKMRAITGLDLPAGQAVELKPGGYHVMLMDLKGPLSQKTHIPLTLVFRNAKGQESVQRLEVPVDMAPMPVMSGHGAHAH